MFSGPLKRQAARHQRWFDCESVGRAIIWCWPDMSEASALSERSSIKFWIRKNFAENQVPDNF
jgi:hypothetical protein